MIWVILALMTAAAMGFVLVPLLRGRAKTTARADYDLAVYKDQLVEVDRDVERGVLTADQAGAARVEIQRRMLAAAEAGGKADAATPRRVMLPAAAVAVLLPVAAFGLYATLGSPQLPDVPHAGREDPARQMAEQAALFEGMVAQLAAKLEANPDDGKGWAMMGRSLRVLGRRDQAVEAYEKAMRLMPRDTQVRLDYAGMLVADVPQGAPLPAEFVKVMTDVNRIDGDQPDALYFLGIAAVQAGDAGRAKTLWTRLHDLLPPESEDRAEIKRMIADLK
ncbi:MAG: c-type cytochrome biogenesis protein CcmI [Pseudomonadota bacterium]